ncbi:RIP metalloprotease RseP [Candidatus Spongiihabitans sp.]|uniref:RIP metalloprotease RseP n=1 Tax=Candidatus Spongiihabitans sp. TaxID=3101308 RepID=UPI003C6F1897
MSDFGYSFLGFLLAIAILVAVHEYGHFWVARKLGVKVLKFSIGFGKSMLKWRRKNDPTEYSIGIIPLGGFVKMLDEREGDVAPEEIHQAFNRKSLAVRTAVVAAGPIFNFLFAIFAIWLVFVSGSADIEPVVGQVVEKSIAENAGFKAGDVMLKLDGKTVKTWGQHQFYMLHQAMKGNPLEFSVANPVHGSRTIKIDFSELDQQTVAGQPITSLIGIWPPAPAAKVSKVVENSPAEQAGLIAEDEILAIDGVAVHDWIDMARQISKKPGETLLLTILRRQQQFDVSLVANSVTVDGKQYGRIGLYRPRLENMTLRFGPLESIWQSLDYNWRTTAITLRSLGRMLSAKMSSENLSGPITIARLAGQTVKSGYADFLKFLAIISVSLGLLNLLPIPVLDGGHLMYFLIEAITGKAPSEKIMIWGQQIGIAMILMLMVLAFYNDIMRLL